MPPIDATASAAAKIRQLGNGKKNSPTTAKA
jgi:hypothetical protein